MCVKKDRSCAKQSIEIFFTDRRTYEKGTFHQHFCNSNILGASYCLHSRTEYCGRKYTKSIDTSSEVLLVEGKVKQFNTESQTILLQLKDGEKITILVDWNTTLVGYTSSTEIEKGNKVKIWQSTTDGTATAVKIEKKLMVVC